MPPATPDSFVLSRLENCPDEIQFQAPYSYLGFWLTQDRVFTPKTELHLASLKTLHGFQQLLGCLQFLRPCLKISPEVLLPLHDLLTGDPCPLSPRSLNPQALTALTQIGQGVSS